MKNIIVFKNGIETLSYFSEQLALAFEKWGHKVFRFDLDTEEKSFEELTEFCSDGENIVICFNFDGLRGEESLYDAKGELYWKKMQIPCVNIMVDHPFYYHELLEKVECELGMNLYYQVSIDKDHEMYLRRFFPQIKHIIFLPLGGTEYGGKDKLHRTYDIVFTGNYVRPEEFRTYIERIDEEYTRFYEGIIADLIRNPDISMEMAFEKHLRREMNELTEKDLMTCMGNMIFIDLYVRFYFRGEVVRCLADAGFKVHVFGTGWEKLECNCRENIILEGGTDSVGCLKALSNAKISLNVMPWFKRGAHDRIYNSMLNGAVVVTDESTFLREDLKDGENVIFYTLKKYSELPNQIQQLLGDGEKRKKLSEKGYHHAKVYHTWENRAKELKKFWEKEEKV